MKPNSLAFLHSLSRSTDATLASIADNCRFDERTADGRWAKFEEKLVDPNIVNWDDWGEADKLNYENTIRVVGLSVPDTFLEINRPAWLEGLIDNRDLVRLECLQQPLAASALGFDELASLKARAASGDADATNAIQSFLDAWDRKRDRRPAFAAFYDEVKAESDADDWPHALRDRLGLGHYGIKDGAALPFALMRYSLETVLLSKTLHKLPTACALPTVLDGGMHEFFFPVPTSHPFGATLHLDPDKADWLTAEILHCRLEYKPEHLWKIGWINRPHAVMDERLRESRDFHLFALRDACKRTDFAEALVGRT